MYLEKVMTYNCQEREYECVCIIIHVTRKIPITPTKEDTDHNNPE